MSTTLTTTTTLTDEQIVLHLEHGRLFGRRRLTSPHPYPPPASVLQSEQSQSQYSQSCNPLPLSLAALDLSLTSSSIQPAPTLAALRAAVLSYLADLEQRLAGAGAELPTAHEARTMLRRIRADVCAHLPDTDGLRAYAGDLKAHLPELDLQARLKDVRAHFPAEISISHPAHYLPVLAAHLRALHAHLSAAPESERCPMLLRALPTAAGATVMALLDRFLESDYAPAVLHREHGQASALEKGVGEMKVALKKSVDGARLVTYVDLPVQWRNNPWVNSGYRFIPLNKWPFIIVSIFMLHNETLNIHTHMIPFLYKATQFLLSLNAVTDPLDRPEAVYTIFAMFCLFASVVWHTMAGCAHLGGMELCARVDYVGIGWLISASVGSIVYYGFSCNTQAVWLYLSLCLAMGVTGSIFPFMDWFNENKYRKLRVLFFLSMALVGSAPLLHLLYTHGLRATFSFISPLIPSLLSYLIGLAFYISHFPERFVARSKVARWTDWLGGGSHALWHACIVLAIFQHRWGMKALREGPGGVGCVV